VLGCLQGEDWGYREETKVAYMARQFNVVVEKDSEGFFVASVPALSGCHTQARSLDELMDRIKAAIELCLEIQKNDVEQLDFVGVQRVTVYGCQNTRRLQAKYLLPHSIDLAS